MNDIRKDENIKSNNKNVYLVYIIGRINVWQQSHRRQKVNEVKEFKVLSFPVSRKVLIFSNFRL